MLLSCRPCGGFSLLRRRAAADRQPPTLTLGSGPVRDTGKTAGASLLNSGMQSELHELRKKKKQNPQIWLEPLFEGSPRAGLHSSGPGKSPTLNSPKWLSHFNSNTRFSFSKVLIQLDLDLFGWVICLKGIISHLLTVVISLLRWLKHLFSAIFSPVTHPTPTN